MANRGSMTPPLPGSSNPILMQMRDGLGCGSPATLIDANTGAMSLLSLAGTENHQSLSKASSPSSEQLVLIDISPQNSAVITPLLTVEDKLSIASMEESTSTTFSSARSGSPPTVESPTSKTNESDQYVSTKIIDGPAKTHNSNDVIVTLCVGERTFKALASTLIAGSTYFEGRLSGRWDNYDEIFLDLDPTAFEHVLKYLRSGAMPLLWDRTSGFDYGTYMQVCLCADYLGVDDLASWIRAQRYLGAIKTEYSASSEDELYLSTVAKLDRTVAGDHSVTFDTKHTTKRIYVCPRKIFIHRGAPDKCGKDCAKAQAGLEVEYDEEPVLNTVIMSTKIIVDQSVLMPEDRE